MSPDGIRDAFEAMLDWPQAFQVHITGGEPFLNFPLLLTAVEIATELSIPRYLETNAGWAVSEDLVSQHFTALRNAGLQAILISLSPFHAESVPPKRTLLAIRKANEIFGPEHTLVYQKRWLEQVQVFGVEKPTSLDQYIESYGEIETGRMLWGGYGLISGGRSGYHLGHLVPTHPAESFNGDSCAFDLLYASHSHFDLYGNFVPSFCGGLTVGSWRELPMVLARYHRQDFPTIIGILAEYGPYGLYEAATLEYGYKPLPNGYSGKCHLCVDVRRHLALSGNFPELQPWQFYEEI